MSDPEMADADGLQQVRILLANGRQPPFGVKLGMALVEVDYGHAMFEATLDGSLYNPMGSVHGGFIASMLDSACGIAVHSALKPGFGYTTLELKTSYLRALSTSGGRVRAIGKLVSIGRRTAFSEARLEDESGRLCATASSTLLVFERAASG